MQPHIPEHELPGAAKLDAVVQNIIICDLLLYGILLNLDSILLNMAKQLETARQSG